METFEFTPQFNRRLQLLGIDQTAEDADLSFALDQLNSLAAQIRRVGYPKTEELLGVAEDPSTPKLEAWLYSLGPAKTIAIGTMELLSSGVIIMFKSEHLFNSKFDFCRTCLSFLVETRAIERGIFLKFPQVEMGISLYEELCKDLCAGFDIIYEEALQAAQE